MVTFMMFWRKRSHGIDLVEMRISGARIETQSGRATFE
jgi:hypothetical protein